MDTNHILNMLTIAIVAFQLISVALQMILLRKSLRNLKKMREQVEKNQKNSLMLIDELMQAKVEVAQELTRAREIVKRNTLN